MSRAGITPRMHRQMLCLGVVAVALSVVGAKDLWQHRTGFVDNTRWWPPFSLTVDWVAAAIVAIAITTGVDFG